MTGNSKKHVIELLSKDVRFDGRKALEYRKPLKVEYNISANAEGSAQVTLGDTVVMAGVKLAVEKPYPDTPEAGLLMVNAELTPLANPEFVLGPPDIDAIELSRIVDRGIRESKIIDMEALCLEKGEKAWSVMIDVIPINDAGNLFDASALAALAALKVTKFPKLEDGAVDYKQKTNKALPIDAKKETLSVTVFRIGKNFLVDPTIEEAALADARLTVATLADGTLCALQKGGDYPLTSEEIDRMVSIGVEKGRELRKAL
jgi:exosome complex component RRP42